jgi:chorismate-pyruvate lyase
MYRVANILSRRYKIIQRKVVLLALSEVFTNTERWKRHTAVGNYKVGKGELHTQ